MLTVAAAAHCCCCSLLLLHATAAACHCCCTQLQLLLALLCLPLPLLLALLCSLLLSLRAPSGSSIGSLPKLCCSLLEFSPHTRGTCLRQGRKTKDASRSVTCAAACLGCESMWRCSGLMPRAALCLEGHWVKMRPGAAVMAHPCRRMAVGCHRPRAQRGTSCCAVTGASSAALRGGEMFRLLAFFHEPSQLHVYLPACDAGAPRTPTRRFTGKRLRQLVHI